MQVIATLCLLMTAAPLMSQNKATLRGKIYSQVTKQAVDFATVILLEARTKTFTASDGSFRVSAPEKGTYTVIIQSPGMKQVRQKLAIDRETVRDFILSPVTTRSDALVVTGKRDLQKVSRYTMTLKELKEVPATFGDSVNALTSLPGVIRMGNDLFGPMVIRGGNFLGTNFFVDDIPMYNPLHYGGLHSVINSNLMDKIDLFPSAFPARFGNTSSAVISINTVDTVKDFGGYIEISAISSSILIKTPILRKREGDYALGYPLLDERDRYEEAGYIIASARRGYVDLIAIPLAELITGDEINVAPVYWDYQFKARYNFDRHHSLTLLAMGSGDYIKFINDAGAMSFLTSGSDPLLWGLEFSTDRDSHNQGLYYTYRPTNRFQNRLILTSSLMDYYSYLNIPSAGVSDALKGYHVDSLPYIWGLRERMNIVAVKDILELYLGGDISLYYFTATGKTIATLSGGMFGNQDLSEVDAMTSQYLDYHIINYIFTGFLEAKLTWGWLTFTPGIRSEYLYRSGEATIDPRGALSIEFPSGTTISVAGGKYSYFFQVNPFIFNSLPQVARIGGALTSEKAIHRSVGIEQLLGLYSVRLEGYYNNFYDLAEPYYHYDPYGRPLEGLTSGRITAYGFELLLKKDLHENEDGFFGWVSYTYTRSRYRSNLPPVDGLYGNPANQAGDLYGYCWITYPFEQRHSLKVIAGFTFFGHTISGKFQLYSSFPYTPIIGGQHDDDFFVNYGLHRYYPRYGFPYSRRFPPGHRLDIRYSHRRVYSWGYVTFYVELINVYNYIAISSETWDYRLDYGPGNPSRKKTQNGLGLIPNFGVEVKF